MAVSRAVGHGGSWDRWWALQFRRFDDTHGFPGEGPDAERLVFGSANVTHWSSFLKAEMWQGDGSAAFAAWMLQETKLAQHKPRRKASGIADIKGWGFVDDPAVCTERDGTSSGAAVLWDRTFASSSGLCKRSGCGRWCRTVVEVGGIEWHLMSFYGVTGDASRTAELLCRAISSLPNGALWVIGGDFNVSPAVCRGMVAGSPAVVISPSGDTCFPSVGAPSVLDFFLVSPAAERLIDGCWAIKGAGIKTHRPVALAAVSYTHLTLPTKRIV